MRRLAVTALIAALVAAAGWIGYQRVWLPRQTAAQEVPTYETVSVERASIASTVNATVPVSLPVLLVAV